VEEAGVFIAIGYRPYGEKRGKKLVRQRWDIFCAVVDNYGDIGVCWRLARQLAEEYDFVVQLWVDDLAPLTRLCPEASADAEQQVVVGVEVRPWRQPFPDVQAADVVIEAFACELPENYLVAMAARQNQGLSLPLWLNLEYLSAEDWVEGCHGMTSPHPRLPLTKHFFFPGFSPRTGGLLREQDYDERRARFNPVAFRAGLDIPAVPAGGLTVSLFAYENSGVGELLAAWAEGGRPILCLVPEGRLLPQVRFFFGQEAGRSYTRGSLTVQVLPFLPQSEYDQVLWFCDLNFVRGEDSFVRAQWAAKPLVWHIYPQDDDHHQVKLQAFLTRYVAGLPEADARALKDFWLAWENQAGTGIAWPAFEAALPSLTAHARAWAKTLANRRDLTAELVSFVMESR
jgi:uncharacterized repeat protein (TIGR03837 family)